MKFLKPLSKAFLIFCVSLYCFSSTAQVTKTVINLKDLKIKTNREYPVYDSINDCLYVFFEKKSNGFNSPKTSLLKLNSHNEVVSFKELSKGFPSLSSIVGSSFSNSDIVLYTQESVDNTTYFYNSIILKTDSLSWKTNKLRKFSKNINEILGLSIQNKSNYLIVKSNFNQGSVQFFELQPDTLILVKKYSFTKEQNEKLKELTSKNTGIVNAFTDCSNINKIYKKGNVFHIIKDYQSNKWQDQTHIVFDLTKDTFHIMNNANTFFSTSYTYDNSMKHKTAGTILNDLSFNIHALTDVGMILNVQDAYSKKVLQKIEYLEKTKIQPRNSGLYIDNKEDINTDTLKAAKEFFKKLHKSKNDLAIYVEEQADAYVLKVGAVNTHSTKFYYYYNDPFWFNRTLQQQQPVKLPSGFRSVIKPNFDFMNFMEEDFTEIYFLVKLNKSDLSIREEIEKPKMNNLISEKYELNKNAVIGSIYGDAYIFTSPIFKYKGQNCFGYYDSGMQRYILVFER
jgi:hypothetical protein